MTRSAAAEASAVASVSAPVPVPVPVPASEPVSEHTGWRGERDRLRAAGHDAVEAAFFAEPPEPTPEQVWREIPTAPMDPTARRAMWATVAILGISLVALTSYVVYHRVIMPVPEDLSGSGVAAQPAPPRSGSR